jgi:hypothetical protein
MLIKASNGLIADNIIDSPGFGGIAVSPDYDSIYVSLPPSFYFFILFYFIFDFIKASDSEGDYSQNITIRNNWLRNVDYWPHGDGWGAIFLTSSILSGLIPPAGWFVSFSSFYFILF